MSAYDIGKLVGVGTGFLIGILICIVIFKLFNKNGKVKTEYDERQQAIRGKAYKYGFYTLVAGTIIQFMKAFTEINLPVNDEVVEFIVLFAGIAVVIFYSIIKGVYFGLNNDPKKYVIFFAIMGVLEMISAIRNIISGEMIVDGKLSTPCIYLISGVLFLAVTIVLIAKKEEE